MTALTPILCSHHSLLGCVLEFADFGTVKRLRLVSKPVRALVLDTRVERHWRRAIIDDIVSHANKLTFRARIGGTEEMKRYPPLDRPLERIEFFQLMNTRTLLLERYYIISRGVCTGCYELFGKADLCVCHRHCKKCRSVRVEHQVLCKE